MARQLMGDTLETGIAAERPKRSRVRTPGKHIVLFSLAVTFMIALSTLMMSRADIAMPDRPFAAARKPLEETFVTDLAPDAQGRSRLLKLTVGIEAGDAASRKVIEEKRAAIRERLAFFLRELTPDDLDGTPAQERLKSELQRRVDVTLAPDATGAVTVHSLIIQ